MSLPQEGHTRGSAGILKIIWIILCVIVLVYTLSVYHRTHSPEAGVIQAYLMIALSFPASILFAFLLGGLFYVLNKFFEIDLGTGYADLVLSWLTSFIVGYLQWFKLVPFLLTRGRNKKQE